MHMGLEEKDLVVTIAPFLAELCQASPTIDEDSGGGIAFGILQRQFQTGRCASVSMKLTA